MATTLPTHPILTYKSNEDMDDHHRGAPSVDIPSTLPSRSPSHHDGCRGNHLTASTNTHERGDSTTAGRDLQRPIDGPNWVTAEPSTKPGLLRDPSISHGISHDDPKHSQPIHPASLRDNADPNVTDTGRRDNFSYRSPGKTTGKTHDHSFITELHKHIHVSVRFICPDTLRDIADGLARGLQPPGHKPKDVSITRNEGCPLTTIMALQWHPRECPGYYLDQLDPHHRYREHTNAPLSHDNGDGEPQTFCVDWTYRPRNYWPLSLSPTPMGEQDDNNNATPIRIPTSHLDEAGQPRPGQPGPRGHEVPPVLVTDTDSWVTDEMDTSHDPEHHTNQPDLYTTVYTQFGPETNV